MTLIKYILTVALPFATSAALAAENKLTDLPQSGFVLLDSTVIAEPSLQFTSLEENGYLVLKSTLSPQWKKGIYINLQNGRVTVPGVGAADLVKNDRGYTWTTNTVEPTFEKHGSLTLTRMAQGCEMAWDFLVMSRGERLVRESGRLAYACRPGASLVSAGIEYARAIVRSPAQDAPGAENVRHAPPAPRPVPQENPAQP